MNQLRIERDDGFSAIVLWRTSKVNQSHGYAKHHVWVIFDDEKYNVPDPGGFDLGHTLTTARYSEKYQIQTFFETQLISIKHNFFYEGTDNVGK